jgi:hypothetical protein
VGETEKRPFQRSFNSCLRVEFQGARVTAYGGLILVRELDERLGFGDRSIVAWRVTKTLTTPSVSLRIRPSGSSSAPGRSGSVGQR